MFMRGCSSTGSGLGPGLGTGAEPINKRLCGLITAKVTHGILNAILMISDTVKVGIMEIMVERHRSF